VADHRHKRDTNARSRLKMLKAIFVAGPIALVVTLSTVGAGVLATSPETRDLLVVDNASTSSSSSSASGSVSGPVDLSDRPQIVSRSDSRVIERLSAVERMMAAEAVARAIRGADTRMWTTAPLNLWTKPDDTASKVGVVPGGKKALVTGRNAADRVEVVVDGKSRWVTAGYLAKNKPSPEIQEPEEVGLGGACTNGSSVSGQPNVIGVHQAVCAAFPEITSYGTYRSDGEHAQGLAIDIMVSGSPGWEVAEFLRANYSELGISYIMYSQKIWSVDRGSEGWRYVEDRGSVTANHYDHVHVTTY